MDEARTTPPDRVAEPRAADLQVQFEQVSVALTQLRQTHERLHEMETRLAEMTRDCAGILERWARNDERHASAVIELHSRLSEWNDLERKLLNESATRIHQFERSLQHEWSAIRQKHEEPIQRLDAEAVRITETCLAAIDGALKGFDRAEARLGALEQQMYREMEGLAREVREAVSELRDGQPQIGPRRPWSLDNVVRLHNELRADGSEAGEPAPALVVSGGSTGAAVARVPMAGALAAPAQPAAAAGAEVDAVTRDLLSPAAEHPADEASSAGERARPLWRRPVVLLGTLLAAAAIGYAGYLRSTLSAGLRDAAARAEASERLASETRDLARDQLAALEKSAQERIATAQQAAAAAQAVTGILAAPDLRRFDLVGGTRAVGATAQVLWSRSRGTAISVSGLRVAPPDRHYELWLLTAGRATAVGPIVPDASGRASAHFDPPASIGRVISAMVTLESGSSVRPTGPPVLTLAPTTAPAVTP